MRGPHPYDKLCFQRTALHYGAKGWELFNLGIPLDSDCRFTPAKQLNSCLKAIVLALTGFVWDWQRLGSVLIETLQTV